MQIISTDNAPKAIGPYSQGVLTATNLFVSGQIALDPATGTMVTDDITAEAEQILRNLGAILKAAGLGYENVVKTTVFVTDIAYFDEVNRIYAKYFCQNPPARSFVQAAALPKGARVEIELIAAR